MKKCVVCEKEVSDEFCETCLEFLRVKYGKKAEREFEKFREWRSSEKEVRKK